MNMITKVISKKQTQAMIKALRDAGLTVEKLNAGYQCKVGDQVVFKAMNGSRGYLVRYADQLFV